MEYKTYPVISLWAPWSFFIMNGWKTIETRTHNRYRSLLGKTILIHSGQHWDKQWYELAGQYMTNAQVLEITTVGLFRGKKMESSIVCSAFVKEFKQLHYDCESANALIDCSGGSRYGLFLNNIKRIDTIFIKGQQGIWYYDDINNLIK